MTEYRIDDLAREAGTTTRNVRGYQDRGLLPRPLRRGRIAIYTDVHLSRLRVINDLLRRGFTIRHISDFLAGLQRGDDLVEVLGLEEVVTKPWSRTTTSTALSADEIAELLHTRDPALIGRLVEFGLIAVDQDSTNSESTYRLLDQETVDAYSRLVKRGVGLSDILDVHAKFSSEIDAVAATVIKAGRRAITADRADGWVPQSKAETDWAAELLSQMRHAATVSVHNALDRSLDRVTAAHLDDYLTVARQSSPPVAD